MTKQKLYPFPRLTMKDLDWSQWVIQLNGNQISPASIADGMDANSELVFGISVHVSATAIRGLGIRNPKLALTVTCPSAAYSAYDDAELRTEAASMVASTEVRIAGSDVSQVIILRPEIIGDDPSQPWLRRRILAEGPPLRIPLDTELDGFPTSSYSFGQRGLPEAPWRIVVSADELEAPFAHSIRLELNEDYVAVRKLIKGTPQPHLVRELDATIVRVLIATAARLSSGQTDGHSPDEVAAEFPDSIAAAAKRAAEQFLQSSLAAAVKTYRLMPERHEFEVASSTGILRE